MCKCITITIIITELTLKKNCAAQFPGIFKMEYTNSKETDFFSVRPFQKINCRGPRYHITLHFECKVDRPFVNPNANNSCFEYIFFIGIFTSIQFLWTSNISTYCLISCNTYTVFDHLLPALFS